jgi:hypothetical protein
MSTKDEQFRGEMDLESVHVKNKPTSMDIFELHLDGDLLYISGIIHRGDKNVDFIWAYRRIRK